MTAPLTPGASTYIRPPKPIVANRRFLALWLAQFLSQTAQNAILYTLLVHVIGRTQSSTPAVGVLLMFLLPSLLFGLTAGVLSDRFQIGNVLVITSSLRAVAAFLLFLFHDNVGLLLPLTFSWSSVSQFFPPAAIAAIPHVVLPAQLLAANSFFTLANTGASLFGLVGLAPVLLKLAGPPTVFLTATGCYFAAATLSFALRSSQLGRIPAQPLPDKRTVLQAVQQEFTQAFTILRRDPASAVAMGHLILSSTLVMVFAVLMPLYMTRVLFASPDDAVFVFAPTGLGAMLGLRVVPWLGTRLRPSRIVALGQIGIALALVGFALVDRVALVMTQHDLLDPTEHLGGRSLLVVLAMLLAGPLGVAYALINAPAQTVLHQRAPQAVHGRVVATQLVLANMASLVPLLVIGGLTDLYGINTVILMVAALLALTALATLLWHGETELAEHQ